MLSLQEIRQRSYNFIDHYQTALADDQFWPRFLKLFGTKQRRINNLLDLTNDEQNQSLLWKGKLLLQLELNATELNQVEPPVELSSLRKRDVPGYHLLSDGTRFLLKDQQKGTHTEFSLAALPDHIHQFGFLSGYDSHEFGELDPVNLKAAERLASLHDLLKAQGYPEHALERLLIRTLFCLFADDTGIFPQDSFRALIESQTESDINQLANCLDALFVVLATPEHKRPEQQKFQLDEFPWLGAELFAEPLPQPDYNEQTVECLLECCSLDWRQISPAVFGALFQSIMDPQARRDLGAHYTNEINILKVLRPLFLDQLRDELNNIASSRRHQQQRLVKFQQKLATIKLLDPACGCGNFLVIAYRELRHLELETLQLLYANDSSGGQAQLDIATLIQVDVDQMLGIELESFPAHIAQVALWLTDHQMNQQVSQQFGQLFLRLPLTRSAQVMQGNALQLDWLQLFDCSKVDYIVGNPPFAGAKYMDGQRKQELAELFHNVRSAGLLDYVSGWYQKAAQLMQQYPHIEAAFVSTNSITQGEQVAVLWQPLIDQGIRITFAHRTFQWESDGLRNKAAVHCVIIGFSLKQPASCWLFEYADLRGEPQQRQVNQINPYLVAADNYLLTNRSQPLCDVPAMAIGNKPIDGGHLLFTDQEKQDFLQLEPAAEPYFRQWIGSREFINGIQRWCLWLGDCSADQLAELPHCQQRLSEVQQFRLNSKSPGTRKLAEKPQRFHVENMPEGASLIVPEVSSSNRHYLPVGFISPEILASNLVKVVANASLYHFGILTSQMHMAWMRAVCGRLKSDYRYSVGIVYNNFPWPDSTAGQQQNIAKLAQRIIDCRKALPEQTLADLYSPATMPAELLHHHQALDKAVDNAYGRRRFESDADRLSLLFERYRNLSID